MTLKYFGAAILIIGFIYFLILRAINTKNYKRKSLYVFLSGLPLVIFFIIGRIIDIKNNYPFPNGEFDLAYYSFLIVSCVFLLFFTCYFYIKGYKLKQKFKSGFIKVDKKPTIKDKKEYLYIILKHQNDFLLQKKEKDNNNVYYGIKFKFPHHEFFHDELVQEFIQKNNLDVSLYSFAGKAIKDGNVEDVFYCYKIYLNEIPQSLPNLERIDSYNLLNVSLEDFDKRILFTSIVEDNFEIKIL